MRGLAVGFVCFAGILAATACRKPSSPGAPSTPDAATAPGDPHGNGLADCDVPSSVRVALDGARPFAPNYPHCPEGDSFCDTIDAPPDPKDACFVANANIARAERESRTQAGTRAASTPWDGTTPPKFLDRIDAHLHLTRPEQARLKANGFVVLDRLPYADYASAFHDVFQEELPVYVGLDPAFHAVFRGTELVLERVEETTLKPALGSLLKKLRAGLRAKKPRLDEETLADLDVYLAVAVGLADPEAKDKPGLTLFGHDEAATALLALAESEQMTDAETGVELFGRARVIDFSQLTPRGHYLHNNYSAGAGLEAYFRAVMWLSRLEFNLASRSCRSSQPGIVPDPSQTPREAKDAMALAEIAGESGALAELRTFEDTYGVFAGAREDVAVPDLLRLMKRDHFRSSDADAPEKLRVAIGADFQRTARIHFMPEGTTTLPAIATLLGPRVVPDTAPLTRLVHDRVPGRTDLGAADVAFVLGHDRAKDALKEDLAANLTLGAALDAARAELSAGARRNDVYASWLRAVLAVAAPPSGVVPSYFGKDAFRDHRMNTALVGFGQLRHAFVLLAGQGYDAYGCEIPDGYVEPLVPAWDALLAHVRKVRSVAKGFAGLERVVAMLREIALTESKGLALSEAQRRWLGMVSEHVPNGGYGDTSEPPKWTGWYFDMFEDREVGAGRTSAFVADYFTLTNAGKVKYLGADGPRLGVFVIDVGGETRAMVGPVASGYEAESPIDSRLDDEKALTHAPKRFPWRASYAVPAIADPQIGLEGHVVDCGVDGGPTERRVVLRAAKRVGRVGITLLDHHGDPLGPEGTVEVDTTPRTITFALPPTFAAAPYGVEALRVRIPELGIDRASSPSVWAGKDEPPEAMPERWKGAGRFTIGAEQPDGG